jgi:hypothetical protein
LKVKLLRNPAAAYGCRLREAQTGIVDDELGRRLVAAGIAECLDDAPATAVRAVPPQPAIAQAAPPEIQADQEPLADKPKNRRRPTDH